MGGVDFGAGMSRKPKRPSLKCLLGFHSFAWQYDAGKKQASSLGAMVIWHPDVRGICEHCGEVKSVNRVLNVPELLGEGWW